MSSELVRGIFRKGMLLPEPIARKSASFLKAVETRQRLLRAFYERPIDHIREPEGTFQRIDTPAFIKAQPFPIFGDHSFKLVRRRVLPSRFVATIRSCLVHGRTTATLTRSPRGGTHWVTLPELAIASQLGNYAQIFKAVGRRGWDLSDDAPTEPTVRIDRGFLVGTRHSFNYFHFVVDLLARVLIAEKYFPNDPAPLLVPVLPPQFIELLRYMAPNRAVFTMGPGDLVQVEELVIPASSGYSPDRADRSKAAVFDAPYLPELRKRFKIIYAPQLEQQGRIVYIKRPDWPLPDGMRARNLVNQDEVIAYMRSLGAVIARPEQMTMQAQIALFRQADIIIGMAGAALTNTVFCQPGTAVVLLCQNQIVNPEYFAIMMDAMDLRYGVVACEPVPGTNPHSAHLSVHADLGALAEAMAWARGEP